MDDMTKEQLEFLEDMLKIDSECNKPRQEISLLDEFEMLVSDNDSVRFNSQYHSPEFKESLIKARNQVIHEQRKRTFKLIKSE